MCSASDRLYLNTRKWKMPASKAQPPDDWMITELGVTSPHTACAHSAVARAA